MIDISISFWMILVMCLFCLLSFGLDIWANHLFGINFLWALHIFELVSCLTRVHDD
jgi:hypothetical protein